MIGKVKQKSEILVIFNKYKDTFEDFIDSIDIKLTNILKLVYKKLYNIMPDFENSSIEFKLDKNLLNESQWQS